MTADLVAFVCMCVETRAANRAMTSGESKSGVGVEGGDGVLSGVISSSSSEVSVLVAIAANRVFSAEGFFATATGPGVVKLLVTAAGLRSLGDPCLCWCIPRIECGGFGRFMRAGRSP